MVLGFEIKHPSQSLSATVLRILPQAQVPSQAALALGGALFVRSNVGQGRLELALGCGQEGNQNDDAVLPYHSSSYWATSVRFRRSNRGLFFGFTGELGKEIAVQHRGISRRNLSSTVLQENNREGRAKQNTNTVTSKLARARASFRLSELRNKDSSLVEITGRHRS